MHSESSLRLTDREIAAAFADSRFAEQFPPVLTIEQAADLLQYSVDTIRDWRSRGLLHDCSRKVGKRVRFYRDRLLKRIFNEGLSNE
jgi:excisionase family DNA binding protein